uniref:RNase H type-1 domain-containing protein n=1 Tax=Cannabis sativa TaxID=3483 RepID=A0A803PKN5_CANSA
MIQAIPTYAMACFRLPIKLCKGSWDLAKLRAYFDEPMVNDILEQVQTSNNNSSAPHVLVKSAKLGNLRIFTDAAIDPQCKKHSVGVVVLDNCNRVKAGFSKPIVGLVPPAVAEAKAIFQAI